MKLGVLVIRSDIESIFKKDMAYDTNLYHIYYLRQMNILLDAT
jgi:hypothetical protein